MVINSIDDGIVVLDPQRKIVAANDAFLRRAGASRDIILGCNCKELGAGGCAVADCPTLGCLKDGERQVRICERRTLDGAVAWEEVHASPILDAGGRLTQVVEVWRDISERRAAEAHLAESHRLASIGVARVRILARAEHAARDGADVRGGHPARHAGSRATSATTPRSRASRCCAAAGSRSISCGMSRGQPGSAAVIDVGGAIAAVNRLIEPTARAHSVQRGGGAAARAHSRSRGRGRISERADQPAVECGARLASREGASTVAAGQSGGHLRIRVADNGCGIAAENRKHIFEPFFSLRKGGTGLGLFLTLNFVRRCGGDISVESAPGEGAAFEIVLPALACRRRRDEDIADRRRLRIPPGDGERAEAGWV